MTGYVSIVRTDAGRRWLQVLALLVAVGCHGLSTDLGPEVHEFAAPADYARWWQMVGDCAHLSGGDFNAIRWFTVIPQPDTVLADGTRLHYWTFYCGIPPVRALGCWVPRHAIYLADSTLGYRGALVDSIIVMHEMLHDRLQDASHTRPEWTWCQLLGPLDQ